MKSVILDYKSIEPRFDSLSLCLGYFDGVHIGHQELIKYARKNARFDLGLITFDKPISTFVDNGKTSDVLTSLDDRFKIISKLGVDYYFIFKIDSGFINLNDIDFINLLKKMNVKEIFVGKDFKYGLNNSGSIYTLQDYFDVHVIEIMNTNNKKISTQSIKDLIKEGKAKDIKELLGRNYCVSGTVIEGNKIGRKLGFPTLNLKLSDNYVLPRFGVYKTICYLDNVPHLSISNVGVKPTINDNSLPIIEIHLKDFNVVNNPSVISLEFLDFIREEKKFSSIDELKSQIQKDIEKVF